MRVTMSEQKRLLSWAAPRMLGPGAQAESLPPETIAIGVLDPHGEIRAVIALNAFYDHFASIHIASDRAKTWATRKVLNLIFSYAFRYRGLLRLEARTSVNNLPATILMLKAGFRIEGVAKCGAHDGSDAIVGAMLAKDCPWLRDTAREQSNG